MATVILSMATAPILVGAATEHTTDAR
jgi:hypothetical protein